MRSPQPGPRCRVPQAGSRRPVTVLWSRCGSCWWRNVRARAQRIQTLNQLRHLVFCGPEPIRSRFKDRYKTGLITEAAAMRPRNGSDPVLFTTNVVIRGLARRIQGLTNEVRIIDAMLRELVTVTAPSLLELYGVGVDAAASLLVTAGDNPDRLRSERSWAHLCGVTPVPASSGKTIRYRLNRGGDRQANSALYRIVLTRMSSRSMMTGLSAGCRLDRPTQSAPVRSRCRTAIHPGRTGSQKVANR